VSFDVQIGELQFFFSIVEIKEQHIKHEKRMNDSFCFKKIEKIILDLL
jgi:hypothetical protein